MGIDSEIFKEDYSSLTWEDMQADSMVMKRFLTNRKVIKMSTPGMGLGDNFMASPAIRAVQQYYHPETIIINAHHPSLFTNNPRCIPGVNVSDPGNIELHTWAYMKQPNNGYMAGYANRISVAHQNNIRMGIWDMSIHTRHEFYPTQAEIDWAGRMEEYKPYITVQYYADPPRKFYNVSPNLQRSDSMNRWMTIRDWYDDRWESLVGIMGSNGYNVLQIGCEYEPLIPGCVDMRGIDIRHAFMVVSHSRLLICHESFPQLMADATFVPSLVFMTGRSCADGQGLLNRTLIDFSDGLPCAPCWNVDRNVEEYCPRTCMDRITVDVVVNKTLKLLGRWKGIRYGGR